MDLAKVFYLLKENEKITKDELSECGVDDKYIEFTLENGILEQISDTEFTATDIETLVDYGRYVMKQKYFKAANSIFNCAYAIDPNDFTINYQLFYRAISDQKLRKSRVYKHFDIIYKELTNNGDSALANYYLFLIGNIYGFDSKNEDNTGYFKEYSEKFLNLEEGDLLIPGSDDSSYDTNIFRKNVFSNSYHDVTTAVDKRFTGRSDLSFEETVERELLLKWLKRKRDFNARLADCFKNGSMEDAKKLLDEEDQRRGLTTTNQYILMIINAYFTIQKTDVVPVPKYSGDNTFMAIKGDNFGLAMALEEKRMQRHNSIRESNLHVVLKEIEDLIASKTSINESVIKEEVKEIPQLQETKPVVEKTIEIYNLTDSDKQKIDAKVEKMHNGRMFFLLDPMPEAKRHAIREYVKSNYGEDISTFPLGNEPERRIVLRYKPLVKEHVDIKEVLDNARSAYSLGKYESSEGDYDSANSRYIEAAEYYELALKIGTPRDTTYSGYAMTLYRMKKFDEALDCMKIATIMSKTTGKGNIDFSELIERIENPPEREDRKPKVVVQESEFEDKQDSLLTDELINDIRGLLAEGVFTLEDICKKLGLNEDDTNYIKLIYSRDCYYLGNESTGDKYLKQVTKCEKSPKVKELYKEILVNKKYYHNRYDKNSDQLVFIKK